RFDLHDGSRLVSLGQVDRKVERRDPARRDQDQYQQGAPPQAVQDFVERTELCHPLFPFNPNHTGRNGQRATNPSASFTNTNRSTFAMRSPKGVNLPQIYYILNEFTGNSLCQIGKPATGLLLISN